MTTRPLGSLAPAAAGGAVYCSQRPGADPPSTKSDLSPSPTDTRRGSVAAAHSLAGVMYKPFADTLDAIHHRYFRSGGTSRSARVLEDVCATDSTGAQA